jgi:macrolide transport system ATP-binding/permease protein
MNTLLQDIRYGLRMLGKSPGFAAVAILTLALGIGANTAIFSLIDAVMLRSIPVKDPQSLVVLEWQSRSGPKFHSYSNYGDCGAFFEGGHGGCSFSVPLFKDLRAQANIFSGLAAFFGPVQFDVSGNGPASVARGEVVSGDFFSTLGVSTILGRPLGPADDSPNSSPAMVLSYNYWHTAFGGERKAVGTTIRINNIPFEIVGVASPKFTNLAPGKTQDFFVPLSAMPLVNFNWFGSQGTLDDPYSWFVVLVGRLKQGVTAGQAQSAASLIFRNEMLHGAKPLSKAEDNPRISLVPAEDGLSGQRGHISSLLYVMMIAVAAILLIACANVAGLMLARSAARQKEMAVRLALGAGRARIIRQLLTESVMLSVTGGALGVLLAVWGVHAITALVTSGSERPFGFVIAPDWRVLAFTVGVTFVTGILFGLAPALRSTRMNLTPALKETASSLPGSAHAGRAFGRWFRLSDALVVAQVALSILVLVGAGLLVRTLRNLHEINPGFDTQNVLLFGLDPSLIGYKDAQSAQLFRDLRERFAALPGVTSASYSGSALLSNSLWTTEVHLDGAPRNQNVSADAMSVSPEFFSTLRIPMLAGRGFNSADFVLAAREGAAWQEAQVAWEKSQAEAANGRSGASANPGATLAGFGPTAVIINEAFAKKYFPKQDPVGKHIGGYQGDDYPLGAYDPGNIVIGICGDTKYNDLKREIKPTMYSPFTGGGAHFELRTASNPTALVSAVRSVVAHADNNLPLFEVRTQTEQIEDLLVQERMMARISSFFAVLALALACIGLYGLLSYEVVRRTREIGIRMALGAQQGDVLKLVVGQGIVLALVGAAIGIGVAIGVTRFMASMLYGVHANDPATMIAVAVLLALVALAACFIPARRATRVDPMVALRYE